MSKSKSPICKNKSPIGKNKSLDMTINSYNIIGYSRENINLFYDQIEINLCGGLNSGFGRNLDALDDLFYGNFGILQQATPTNQFHIRILKSRILDDKLKQILEECGQHNEFIKIFFC